MLRAIASSNYAINALMRNGTVTSMVGGPHPQGMMRLTEHPVHVSVNVFIFIRTYYTRGLKINAQHLLSTC